MHPISLRFVSFTQRYRFPHCSFRVVLRRTSCSVSTLELQAWSYCSVIPYRFLRTRRVQDLPGSCVTLVCICPALGPRSDLRAKPFRRFDSAPAVQTSKAPTLSIVSRLYHTAFAPLHTLRAAIADDYAMFASGWWPTFTGRASRPTGSLLCVSESCFRFDYMLFLTFWVYLTRLNSCNF